MTFWQRIKRFSRSLVILTLSCLVLEQVWYSVVIPGYFLGVLVSPVFWGIFSVVSFYLLWRIDADFFKNEKVFVRKRKYTPLFGSSFMSPNYSRAYRELVMDKYA